MRMMISKRSQAEHIFLYILTIVIIGLIVIFGYKAIANLLEVGGTAQKVRFQKDFQNAVAQGRSYGRITTHTFAVGDEYSQICMIDAGAIGRAGSLVGSNVKHPLIINSVEGDVPENSFLVKKDGTIEPYTVETLEAAGGGLCAPVLSGKAQIRFEGMGDRVKVSVPLDAEP